MDINSVGSVITDIKIMLRANNYDQKLHPRAIFNSLIDATYYFINQKNNAQKLMTNSSLIEFLDCSDMVSENGEGCCGLKNVYVTKNEIKTYNVRGSDGILYVTNVDDSIEIDRVSSFMDYKRQTKRRFGKKKIGYVYANNKIYILGASPKKINIAKIKSPSDIATDIDSGSGDCTSMYISEFPCPNDLISYVKQKTVQDFMNTIRITEDQNPNLNSNEK